MSLLSPLSWLYGAAVARRNARFDRDSDGKRQVRRLMGPVVSVGNISVGGTGKTPMVMLLAELLCERGIAVDVLSRGYRRQTRGVRLVDAAGSADEFGDEPLLMAQRLGPLGIPVVVGEDRYAAGKFAEASWGSRLHLLDDGFQHRRLGREFDIVLVSSSDLTDRLLPTGRLREPLASLERADAVVMAAGGGTSGEVGEDWRRADMQRLEVGKPVWRSSRGIRIPGGVRGPAVVFCGIGKPALFFEQVRKAGVTAAAERSFGDHHRYTAREVEELLRLRDQQHGQVFVTTEKDRMNLGKLAGLLQPLAIAEVVLDLRDAETRVDELLTRIAERGKEAPMR